MIYVSKPITIGSPCGTFRINPEKPLKESYEKISDDFMDDEGVADIIVNSGECLWVEHGFLIVTMNEIRTLE